MAITQGDDYLNLLTGKDATAAILAGEDLYNDELPTYTPVYGNIGLTNNDSWAWAFTKSFIGDFSLKPTGKAGKYGNCLENNRLDNAVRSLGAAYGHPDVGNFLGNATLASGGAAVLNAGANVGFGAYVPALFGGSAHFSTWMRAAWGSAGRLPGRIASGAGAALLVGEAAYDATAMIRCAVTD